jgi:hypothetical protein
MMFSSVTKPITLFFSMTGSCLISPSIIILAAWASVVFRVALGACRISDLTLAVFGSIRALSATRRRIRPEYLPFWSMTTMAGGISFLKSSMHFDSGSFSLTVMILAEKTSPTEIEDMTGFPLCQFWWKVEFKRCNVFFGGVFGFVGVVWQSQGLNRIFRDRFVEVN